MLKQALASHVTYSTLIMQVGVAGCQYCHPGPGLLEKKRGDAAKFEFNMAHFTPCS
jgi:hypothetical protein